MHRYKAQIDAGIYEGETCARDGCEGVIETRNVECCSCHISPPCSACTEPRNYCDKCGWEESDDEKPPLPIYTGKPWEPPKPRELDPTKIDWHSFEHTHFSMIKRGVYPEGATEADVRKLINGTFGGRFSYFGNGRFEFVAYTD